MREGYNVILGERVGIRTRDPLIKSQMLYRLSYTLSHMRDLFPKDVSA